MEDDQGSFGLMVFFPRKLGALPKTATIENGRQFEEAFNKFKVEESYS